MALRLMDQEENLMLSRDRNQEQVDNISSDVLQQRHLSHPTPFHMRQPRLQDLQMLPMVLPQSHRPLIAPEHLLSMSHPQPMWTPQLPPPLRSQDCSHILTFSGSTPVLITSTDSTSDLWTRGAKTPREEKADTITISPRIQRMWDTIPTATQKPTSTADYLIALF